VHKQSLLYCLLHLMWTILCTVYIKQLIFYDKLPFVNGSNELKHTGKPSWDYKNFVYNSNVQVFQLKDLNTSHQTKSESTHAGCMFIAIILKRETLQGTQADVPLPPPLCKLSQQLTLHGFVSIFTLVLCWVLTLASRHLEVIFIQFIHFFFISWLEHIFFPSFVPIYW